MTSGILDRLEADDNSSSSSKTRRRMLVQAGRRRKFRDLGEQIGHVRAAMAATVLETILADAGDMEPFSRLDVIVKRCDLRRDEVLRGLEDLSAAGWALLTGGVDDLCVDIEDPGLCECGEPWLAFGTAHECDYTDLPSQAIAVPAQ